MNVAITGTRHGMTEDQLIAFTKLLQTLGPIGVFRHGDCRGADDQGANVVRTVVPSVRIIAHPGPDGEWRAHNGRADETLPEKSHFARNRDLVDLSDVVIVCPREMEKQQRGGTWYTEGYSRKKGKRTIIVWPDGTLTDG